MKNRVDNVTKVAAIHCACPQKGMSHIETHFVMEKKNPDVPL
jgi:hypothetical protein